MKLHEKKPPEKKFSEGSGRAHTLGRYYTLFFVLLVATPICALNAAVQTGLRAGPAAGEGAFLWAVWGEKFALAYALTVPAALVAVPLARRTLTALGARPQSD